LRPRRISIIASIVSAMMAGTGLLALELPVHAGRNRIDGPALDVVAGVIDILIVQRQARRSGERVAVLGLDDLLQARLGELPIADQNAEAARTEECDVLAGNAVENARDAARDERSMSRLTLMPGRLV
jgi:hypothetical protein